MKRILAFTLSICLAGTAAAQRERLAIKVGLDAWIWGHSNVEIEYRAWTRTSVALQIGGIHGQKSTDLRLVNEPIPFFTGFFLKAGPKWGLGANAQGRIQGFALQPQAIFSYWNEWDYRRAPGGSGSRWEMAVGGLLQASYRWRPWKGLLVEPQVGLGYVRTFDRVRLAIDQEPFDTYFTPWTATDEGAVMSSRQAHWPLFSNVSASFGLMLGFSL
jgi:hypothetical protein